MVATYDIGGSFGEMGILNYAKRAATIEAGENIALTYLDANEYRVIVADREK